MFEKDFIVADLETTGLSSKKNEIIEIGAIKVKDFRKIDSMDIFLKPENPVPAVITNLTGITNDMLLNGYNLVEGIKKFVDFVEDYPIVFHNAKFDMGFLNIASNKLYGKDLENHCLDTLVLSRKLVSNVKDYKLGTLADYFNISYDGAHRSLRDCQITFEVYKNLNKIYQNNTFNVS